MERAIGQNLRCGASAWCLERLEKHRAPWGISQVVGWVDVFFLGACSCLDVATAGNGGGLAVRAANATIKVAKAVDKANTIVETAQATVDTTKTIVAAVEGDGRRLVSTVGGALMDMAVDKAMGKKMRDDTKGGAHRDTTKPSGDGLESHHVPADSINGLPHNDGSAIKMDPADHKATSQLGEWQ